MLLIAVSGAAVLAVVCWVALREAAAVREQFIPQGPAPGEQDAPTTDPVPGTPAGDPHEAGTAAEHAAPGGVEATTSEAVEARTTPAAE